MEAVPGQVVYNPMTVGPSVNGRVFDPGTQRNQIEYAPPKDAVPSSVLNDALLQAAVIWAGARKRAARVIFILSDGRESGSHASYKDVSRLLLTNNVSVYGVAIDAGPFPATTSWPRFTCRARATATCCRSTPRQPAAKFLRNSLHRRLGVRLRQRDGRGTQPVHAGVQHLGNCVHRPTARSRFGSAATVPA